MTEEMLRALGPLKRCDEEPCDTCDEIDRQFAALIGTDPATRARETTHGPK